MNALYCIGGIILIGLVYFFAWCMCCMAAQAETYQLHRLEEESKPKVTGEL